MKLSIDSNLAWKAEDSGLTSMMQDELLSISRQLDFRGRVTGCFEGGNN
jgi:hypothetical protein